MINEDLLRRAAAKASEKHTELLAIGYDSEKQHIFSKAFERKIKRLTRRTDHPVFYKISRSAASILVSILVAGSFWLTFDGEARAAFIGWIKETYKTFFTYQYTGPDSENLSVQYYLSYIPEGYTEVLSDCSGISGDALYVNADGDYLRFSYISDPDSSVFQIDTNSTKHYRVAVNMISADYFEAIDPNVSSGILWMDENHYLFYVTGYFDQAQLIRIAENVEMFKKSLIEF